MKVNSTNEICNECKILAMNEYFSDYEDDDDVLFEKIVACDGKDDTIIEIFESHDVLVWEPFENYSASFIGNHIVNLASQAQGMVDRINAEKNDRSEFMAFFRSEKYDLDLSEEYKVEIFLGALQGSSDIDSETIKELLASYDVSVEEFLEMLGAELKADTGLDENSAYAAPKE